MTSPELTALHEQLVSFVGRTSGPPRIADDEVNAAMIRHWCQALGDANPLYTDPVFAASTPFGQVAAPPAMLQTWTHHDRRFPLPDSSTNSEEELAQLLVAAGFSGAVATRCDATYLRYLHIGDVTSYQAEIVAVSPPKSTALGTGFFVQTLMTYRDQAETVVGTLEFTTLRYQPRGPGE